MRKNILALFLLMSLSILGQDICKSPIYVLNRKKLKETIKRDIDLSGAKINLLNIPTIKEKDVDKILYLRNMYISPTSTALNVESNIDTTEILMLTPSNHVNLYTWDSESNFLGAMSSARSEFLIICIRVVTEKESYNIDPSMMFNVSIFPNEKHETRYFACKKNNSTDLFFIDQKMNIFQSLEELLQYYFGSKENYIVAYNFRANWAMQKQINQQTFFEKK